jgi:hypothetical protein
MVKITKLPSGEAYGARDLQKWSHNRLLGRWGVSDSRSELKKHINRTIQLSKAAGGKAIRGFDGKLYGEIKKPNKKLKHKKSTLRRTYLGNGEPCRKCNSIMGRYSHGGNYIPPKYTYHYKYWDICRGCKHVQHYECAKVTPGKTPKVTSTKAPLWENVGDIGDTVIWDENEIRKL